MRYYIDSKKEIFAFESDGSQDRLITADMQPITDAEMEEMRKPTQEQLDAKRVSEIDSRLRQIDVESDRPLRAIEVARARGETPNQYDIDRLISLEGEAQALRDERKGLTG